MLVLETLNIPSSEIHQIDYRRFSHHLACFIFSFLGKSYGHDGVGSARKN